MSNKSARTFFLGTGGIVTDPNQKFVLQNIYEMLIFVH